jgi:hypothetical protein
VKVDDDVVIFDAGLYLPPIVELEEKDRIMTEKNLFFGFLIDSEFFIF